MRKGPFLEKLPAKMDDMKGLKALSYTSPREAIAEKFHMSEELLAALNPGKKFDQAGETVSVTNVLTKQPKLERSAGSKSTSRGQTVKAFAPSASCIALFPATVGSDEKPTPGGTLKVVSADANPNYRYNPDYKFKGVKSKEAFTIKPGPNNPVGSYWIGLSSEGYGIHGTPNRFKVSKSESHGCVRLTNWDVGAVGQQHQEGNAGGVRRRAARRPQELSASDCLTKPTRRAGSAVPAHEDATHTQDDALPRVVLYL